MKTKYMYAFVLSIFSYFNSESYSDERKIGNIQWFPEIINADLNGDSKNEKIIIKESTIGRYPNQKVSISIIVYESDKIVFNFKEFFDPIRYAYVVRLPGYDENNYRDLVFIVTQPGLLKLNILCWESLISETDVYKKAISKDNFKFKGRYRFIKTDIQVNTPYG